MKYIIFSLDDGTIYDKDVIALFNKYHIRGTFNLNSNLPEYTWYTSTNKAIYRPNLINNIHLYDNHEIASHTLTHPNLTQCDDNEILRQVNGDITYLKWIFRRDDIVGFAIPFSDYNEHIIKLIKNNTDVSYIRLPEIDESFTFPKDQYHIKVTALNIDRANELLDRFLKSRKKDLLFLYAGHSYDFYLDNSFDKLESFLKRISSNEKVNITTLKDFIETAFNKE